MGKRRITIKQVAQEAEVSTQTVSRVINQRPDVSPETRQRILNIIDRLGYHPSAIARSLIQQRSYTLGVVIAGLKYIGPSMTLNGIVERADELGYTLLLKELPTFGANNIQPILQSLLARQVDGILWAVPEVGNNRDWLLPQQGEPPLELPVPILILTMQPRNGIAVTAVDNYYGGLIATRHLIEQGYRRIGHISGPLEWWEARQRKTGWGDALAEAGLPVEERFCVQGNWSSSSGAQAFRSLLEQYAELDAIFVANDQMALSVLQGACLRDLRIPQDLGVIGFDGLAESAYFWPPLTTIDQDLYALGCTAVANLVRMIEAKGDEVHDLGCGVLQPHLVVRQSSAGPR